MSGETSSFLVSERESRILGLAKNVNRLPAIRGEFWFGIDRTKIKRSGE